MKKKLIAVSAVFVLFLTLGLWYNLTPGRYLGGDFWKLKDGVYSHMGDEIRPAEDGSYAISLEDYELTADLSETEGVWRVEFSDGWAVEMKGIDASFGVQVGGILLTGETEYILMDVDAPNLRFGKAVAEKSEPFYDENGNAVGEMRYIETESGESVGWQEIWYEQPDWDVPQQQTIQLYDGIRLTYDDFNRNLLVNEDGEYLMNAQDAPLLRMSGGSWQSRNRLASMLIRLAEGEPERRGHAAVALLYAFVYWAGAVQFLWPHKLAFFGSRWQYRIEPELSDEGMFVYLLCSVIVMIMGIATLFIGYQ